MDAESLVRFSRLLTDGFDDDVTAASAVDGTDEEIRTAPIFSYRVARSLQSDAPPPSSSSSTSEDDDRQDSTVVFPQFGLLGATRTNVHRHILTRGKNGSSNAQESDMAALNPLFLNTNSPSSTFICGSQGSGKSHSLSILLENCLLPSHLSPSIGRLPHLLSGLVLHFNNTSGGSVAEAAHIASAGVPVTVLVSASNLNRMTRLYSEVPVANDGSIHVKPLLFQPRHINTERMLKLMSMSGNGSDGKAAPLYMETVMRVLREIAQECDRDSSAFSYREFSRRILELKLTRDQEGPLNMRLLLLESFLDQSAVLKGVPKKVPHTRALDRAGESGTDIFENRPGHLTIVDLTDPFVDSNTACLLFEICLSIFLSDSNSNSHGRVVALDEAHKYMNETSGAASGILTNTLLTTIREQRHSGTRVIVSTQEPTVEPALLDLCNVTIVHRFSSPAWLRVLQKHLAGASEFAAIGDDGEDRVENGVEGDQPGTMSGSPYEFVAAPLAKGSRQGNSHISAIFSEIVRLNVGQALVFAPAGMLDLDRGGRPRKMGSGFKVVKMRPRIGGDGGRSVLATGR